MSGLLVRPGRYQDVLADAEPDTIITDPPFDERTHKGARTCAEDGEDGISFAPWTDDDVHEFVERWAPRTRRWIAAMTCHSFIPTWERAYAEAGMLAFAPVTALILGGSVRKQGDGPANWTVHIMAARHRQRKRMANPCSEGTALWRALPGGYVVTHTAGGGNGRRKPIELCGALVRDYSNRGDLVVDPCAGLGGTLAAALAYGRRALGAELDPAVAEQANAALGAPMQMVLL